MALSKEQLLQPYFYPLDVICENSQETLHG